MQGVGIFYGDLLIVDRHETVRHGDVIVANFNGEFVCKILDKPRRMLLSSNEITNLKPSMIMTHSMLKGLYPLYPLPSSKPSTY
jgi:SOS-response transcriptional repressor LexA